MNPPTPEVIAFWEMLGEAAAEARAADCGVLASVYELTAGPCLAVPAGFVYFLPPPKGEL